MLERIRALAPARKHRRSSTLDRARRAALEARLRGRQGRCGGALRRPEGGRRIGRAAAALLRQQRRRQHRAAQAMEQPRLRGLVFSSSATVYGEPERCRSPRTSAAADQSLRQHQADDRAHPARPAPRPALDFRFAVLRYFNPVGAHASGPHRRGPARHRRTTCMPYIAQVAVGKRPTLQRLRQRLRRRPTAPACATTST